MSVVLEPPTDLRGTLGDFNSIVCFRALVVGVEETLGLRAAMVALKSAGRKRGHQLVTSLGLAGQAPADPSEAAAALDSALGIHGTRLCTVNNIERDGDRYRVFLSETICSAGEEQGSSRELSFTFGAIHGAVECFYGVKLRGKQVGSILRGQDYDIVEFVER
jgi:hypothetical protein